MHVLLRTAKRKAEKLSSYIATYGSEWRSQSIYRSCRWNHTLCILKIAQCCSSCPSRTSQYIFSSLGTRLEKMYWAKLWYIRSGRPIITGCGCDMKNLYSKRSRHHVTCITFIQQSRVLPSSSCVMPSSYFLMLCMEIRQKEPDFFYMCIKNIGRPGYGTIFKYMVTITL